MSLYMPHELIEINSVTRSTDIHTFYIIGICPWTNMLAKLHIYAPLHVYNILHTDSPLLHISVKNNIMQLINPLILFEKWNNWLL